MRSDYVEAYINRGDILIRLNRTREAQDVYEKALQLDDANADIHYNLGVVFLEQRQTSRAMHSFDKALKINPRHEQALLNSAILIQEEGGPQKRKKAYHRLQMLLDGKDVNERVYFHLGMLAMDEKNFTLAEKWFRKAVELRSDFRSALFNLALLLSEARRPNDALPYLMQLRERPITMSKLYTQPVSIVLECDLWSKRSDAWKTAWLQCVRDHILDIVESCRVSLQIEES
ncbi:protein O-mannosyl-transferase TMTC3 [Nephila pilipes]|uniref:Protein O-mannosyl-transferase TMTC3 n=1 Tax=Nephila pilipes TaxID=299642 RepID=A0A8X6U7G8_NEPPI|nr:protein O-mannosyl-transferase TMTC3 [Nephila pilipes]